MLRLTLILSALLALSACHVAQVGFLFPDNGQNGGQGKPGTPESPTPSPTTTIPTDTTPTTTTSTTLVPPPTTTTSTTQPPSVGKVEIEARQVMNCSEDRAGVWNNFGPGAGVHERNPKDFKVSVTVETKNPVTIKSLTLVKKGGSEAWSTSSSTGLTGHLLYPIVVVNRQNHQINTAYDESLSLPAGKTKLYLFVQPEKRPLGGGYLLVEFSTGETKKVDLCGSGATSN